MSNESETADVADETEEQSTDHKKHEVMETENEDDANRPTHSSEVETSMDENKQIENNGTEQSDNSLIKHKTVSEAEEKLVEATNFEEEDRQIKTQEEEEADNGAEAKETELESTTITEGETREVELASISEGKEKQIAAEETTKGDQANESAESKELESKSNLADESTTELNEPKCVDSDTGKTVAEKNPSASISDSISEVENVEKLAKETLEEELTNFIKDTIEQETEVLATKLKENDKATEVEAASVTAENESKQFEIGVAGQETLLEAIDEQEPTVNKSESLEDKENPTSIIDETAATSTSIEDVANKEIDKGDFVTDEEKNTLAVDAQDKQATEGNTVRSPKALTTAVESSKITEMEGATDVVEKDKEKVKETIESETELPTQAQTAAEKDKENVKKTTESSMDVVDNDKVEGQQSAIDAAANTQSSTKETISTSIKEPDNVTAEEKETPLSNVEDTNLRKALDEEAPTVDSTKRDILAEAMRIADMPTNDSPAKCVSKDQNEIVDEASESQESGQLIIDEKLESPHEKNATEGETKNMTTDSIAIIEIDDEIEATTAAITTEDIVESEQKPDEFVDVVPVIEIDDDDDELLTKKSNDDKETKTAKDQSEIPKVEEQQTTTNAAENEIEKGAAALEDAVEQAETRKTPTVFFKMECINFQCPKQHSEYHRAPQFVLNYFNVVKKRSKEKYVCAECYDVALDFYKDLGGQLNAKQPILLQDITNRKQEFFEISDSSDEDESPVSSAAGKEKENTTFSKADLDLIEAELNNSIRNIFDRVDIQSQLTWSKTIFSTRLQRMEDDLEFVDAELLSQQKMADKMYRELYESGNYRINTLKPLDLDRDVEPKGVSTSIPPIGSIERPAINLYGTYYAAKNKAIGCWMKCTIVEELDFGQVGLQKNVPHYKVRFLNAQYQAVKCSSAKLIAYYEPPKMRLSVGQRVIAYFNGSSLTATRDKEKSSIQSAFYPGIIAEEMKSNNFFRYLIFYDDGYTQYVYHKDVRLVCHVSKNVWEDVDHTSREFIQKYVMEYRVNRPMVQAHKGQKMTTESNGRWIPARVIDIDCSLVHMQFEGTNRNTEWIYRGSLRLHPVYMEYQKSKNIQAKRMPVSRLPRRTEPFIRYTEDEETIRGTMGTQQPNNISRQDSTSSEGRSPAVRHLNANTIYLEDENKPKGKVIYYTAKRQLATKLFKPHDCGPQCPIVVPHNLNGYSPLAKPLLSGWERIFHRQKIKKFVYYRAPCGRMLRSMSELHHYLRLTKNTLNVDNFDFYSETSCLAEFEAENIILKKRDISNGQEKMALPLVNYYDDSLPDCVYAAKVIPTEGVHINTDPDFLICCDCIDDCSDKTKCACWQLTIEGARTLFPDTPIDEIGYQYKRLYNYTPSGIYECNSRCKCQSNCLNRVVQNSLEMKLQVFKTTNRGWGLRCLNDVPRGGFICIYAGNLLTEAKANEGGLDAGDEYFAELDYIETVEQYKEGYESDVEPPEDEEEEDPYVPEDNDDDDDFRPGKHYVSRSKRKLRESTGERQAINYNPNVSMDEDTNKKKRSVRALFGKDEAVYVMDAKVTGNLGRYFNHSCSPNLFVQNVFVDTHDVRFPWVAFFALSHIRAGTELTWNYNYEVGLVPGKVLYCQCGAPNCRVRLL